MNDLRYALRTFARSPGLVAAAIVCLALGTGADEDRLGGAQVVVVSDALWRRALGGDAGVLGRALRLGQNLYTVIGVAPKGFTGVNLEVVDVWAPLAVATPDVMGGASWLNHQSF